MVRIARVEALGHPHHVIQRGNRRQNVFIRQEDKKEYLKILDLQAKLFGLKVWAYCLMDNHVHLIVVPEQEGSLAWAIGETHRLYTRMINFREGWRGYLWQGRFKSFPLDERYLFAAVRYVERNPVRAKIVSKAQDYEWSSAKDHIAGNTQSVLTRFYLQDEIKDWEGYLNEDNNEEELKHLRIHGYTGRPLGQDKFLEELEGKLGRVLKKSKPGPKKN
jgi:putative transposase